MFNLYVIVNEIINLEHERGLFAKTQLKCSLKTAISRSKNTLHKDEKEKVDVLLVWTGYFQRQASHEAIVLYYRAVFK